MSNWENPQLFWLQAANDSHFGDLQMSKKRYLLQKKMPYKIFGLIKQQLYRATVCQTGKILNFFGSKQPMTVTLVTCKCPKRDIFYKRKCHTIFHICVGQLSHHLIANFGYKLYFWASKRATVCQTGKILNFFGSKQPMTVTLVTCKCPKRDIFYKRKCHTRFLG